MDDLNDETPELAEAVGVSGTHFKGGETQLENTAILLTFPIHRRRSLLTLSERCRDWRAVRVPRGNYRTPLPDDLIERRCNG